MNGEYIVYGLYTEVAGIFYIGCGKAEDEKGPSRLKGTVSECQKMKTLRTYPYYYVKCRYIRACQTRGIKIYTWIFCTYNEKKQAEKMEYALIQRYPYSLTNVACNPYPMKELPSFLYSKEYVRPEHLGQAVDAIIAYNDATSEPKLRWYINVDVVCDLVDAKQMDVKGYLASRRQEIRSHHQKHGLTERDNHKFIMSIADLVKVEPAVVSEPLTSRCQRAVDAIIASNDATRLPLLRWYIDTDAVYNLLGGPASGVERSLVGGYLVSRDDEIVAHHQKHRLTGRANSKFIQRIAQGVKVKPAVAYEPYRERCRRTVDALIAFNNATIDPLQRWYISPVVVYALLGGQSSGMHLYYVTHYLAERGHEIAVHHQQHGLVPSHYRKPEHILEQVKVEPAVVSEPLISRCQRATDAILAYNDAVPEASHRWYISAVAVHELLGRESGVDPSLVERYLASRQEELTDHHQKYGLTERGHRPYDRSIRIHIYECVKVEPAVISEPLILRCQRVVDAIIAYNDATFSPTLRWYICEFVVSILLGGVSSGVDRSQVQSYLVYRREELTAHHRKHGLTAFDKNQLKYRRINEHVKVAIGPEESGESPLSQ